MFTGIIVAAKEYIFNDTNLKQFLHRAGLDVYVDIDYIRRKCLSDITINEE